MAEANQQKAAFKDSGLGYPKIEEILETENFDRLNKGFSEAYTKLENIMKDKTIGLKKQKAAQSAMQAYELTTELMNELLKIKYEIMKIRAQAAGTVKK